MNTIPHRINGSPVPSLYSNGTALFTASGEAARRLQRRIKVTRSKVVTTRRPQQAGQIAAGFDFPTSN
ncbi:hypothetical protein [Streptomyces canus]|uniref:hypothetical protein n=1 Tax=Streptomyces canus TaxID=58343 RepID=UPI0032471144